MPLFYQWKLCKFTAARKTQNKTPLAQEKGDCIKKGKKINMIAHTA